MKQERPPTLLEAMVTAFLVTGVIVLTIRLQPGLAGIFIPLFSLILGYTGIAVWKTNHDRDDETDP